MKIPHSGEDEASRRRDVVKSLQELFDQIDAAPPFPDDYDLPTALDENRKWSGSPPLLPDPDESR